MGASLAVLFDDKNEMAVSQALAKRLDVPLIAQTDLTKISTIPFFLSYRDGCLKLLDKQLVKKGGMMVDIEPRSGEQHSWPAPKKGFFAQAIGKKTKTVVDATTGWAQDSLALFRMGYEITCIERSPVMLELLKDGFKRLQQKDWVQRRGLRIPQLIFVNAIDFLATIPTQPDCIYIDPMFPPKRKKSALAKKSMLVLRDILGNDGDRGSLFAAAIEATGKRVVVKSPVYAEPMGGKPDQVFRGKLLRYDVYIKG